MYAQSDNLPPYEQVWWCHCQLCRQVVLQSTFYRSRAQPKLKSAIITVLCLNHDWAISVNWSLVFANIFVNTEVTACQRSALLEKLYCVKKQSLFIGCQWHKIIRERNIVLNLRQTRHILPLHFSPEPEHIVRKNLAVVSRGVNAMQKVTVKINNTEIS